MTRYARTVPAILTALLLAPNQAESEEIAVDELNDSAFAYVAYSGCLGTCACMDSVPCDEAIVNMPENHTQAQFNLLLWGIEEIKELRFGVEFSDNVSLSTFSVCQGGLSERGPTYPESGSWIEVQWLDCHIPPGPDGYTPVGLFYLVGWDGGPGYFRLVPHKDVGGAVIVACDGSEHQLAEADLPIIGFGDVEGYNPCDTVGVPVVERSWSLIKKLYEN